MAIVGAPIDTWVMDADSRGDRRLLVEVCPTLAGGKCTCGFLGGIQTITKEDGTRVEARLDHGTNYNHYRETPVITDFAQTAVAALIATVVQRAAVKWNADVGVKALDLSAFIGVTVEQLVAMAPKPVVELAVQE